MVESVSQEAIEKAKVMFSGQTTTGQDEEKTTGIFDVGAYLNKYKIPFQKKNNGESTIYCLRQCLFDSSHVNNESSIIQKKDGVLFYQCFHDSCKGRKWREAREKISGRDNLKEFMPGKQEIEQDIQLITLGDINKMSVEFPDPVIEGLLEVGDSLLITGKGGLGKSLMVIAIALAAASGKRLFNQFNIYKPQNILLFQSENSLKATKARIKAIIKLYKDKEDYQEYEQALDRIVTTMIEGDCRISGNILNPVFAQQLQDSLEATNAGLLILDPLISYHQENENANVDMRTALDELLRIANRTKTAIIITHHHGKGLHKGADMARGATAIQDFARSIITLTKQKHESRLLIKCENTKHGNFLQAKPFLLEVSGPSVISVEPDILCPPSEVHKTLIDMGGVAHSKNELVKNIIDTYEISRRTALEAINKAEEFGLINVKKSGQAFEYGAL